MPRPLPHSSLIINNHRSALYGCRQYSVAKQTRVKALPWRHSTNRSVADHFNELSNTNSNHCTAHVYTRHVIFNIRPWPASEQFRLLHTLPSPSLYLVVQRCILATQINKIIIHFVNCYYLTFRHFAIFTSTAPVWRLLKIPLPAVKVSDSCDGSYTPLANCCRAIDYWNYCITSTSPYKTLV